MPLVRRFDKSQLLVSPMGIGCWAIGGPFWDNDAALGWGDINDDESIRAIKKAIELGVNLFDTADVYGAGHSERILGKAVKGQRARVHIATKFGYTFDELRKQKTGANASPDYIMKACEASLKRLNTDYIDLYQFHQSGYDPQGIFEIVGVLEKLVDNGKIRYYGWSTRTPRQAESIAHGEHCISIQHPLNVLQDNPEMISICEKHQLASINRGPLAMGLLSGKYTAESQFGIDDVRGTYGLSYLDYFHEGHPKQEWLNKIAAIREILMSQGRTLVQGALAWIWARSNCTFPIPGFKTVQQITANCKAMEFGPLTAPEMQEISDRLIRISR